MSNPEHNRVESTPDSGSISMAKRDWDRLWDEKKNLEDYLCIAEDALAKEKKKGAELRRDLDGVRRERWEVERQLKVVEQQLRLVEGNLETSKETANSLQRKLDEQVAEGKENRENVEAAHKMGKVSENHLKEAAKIMENLQKEVKVAEDRNKELRTRLIQEQEENGKCQAKFGGFRDAVLSVRVEVTRFEASLGNGENLDEKERRDNTKRSGVGHFVGKKLKELEGIEMSLAEWVGLGETKKMVLDICQIYNSSFGMCTPKATDVPCSTSTVETMESQDSLEAEFPLAGTSTASGNTGGDSHYLEGSLSGPNEHRHSSTTIAAGDRSDAVPSTSVTLAAGSKKRLRVPPKKRRHATGIDNHVVSHTFSMTNTSTPTGNTRGDSDYLHVCLSGPNEYRHSSISTDADKREDMPSTSLTSAVRPKSRRIKPPQKRRHTSSLPSLSNNRVQNHTVDWSKQRKGHYCVCGHKAINRQSLRCHISYYTAERKFWCSECNKRFVYLSRLRRHLKTHGNEINDSRKGCRKCGDSFANYRELKKHHMFSASCKTIRNKVLHVDLTSQSSPPSTQMPVVDIASIKTEVGDGSEAEDSLPILHPYYEYLE